MGKRFLTLLIFMLIAFFWIWYLRLPSPTEKYDKLDNISYNTFKVETTTELNNAIDQNIDNLIEELSSMKSVLYTVTDFVHLTDNKRDALLEELWQNNINIPMDQIITSRVKILVEDMFQHNAECLAALKKEGVNVQSFEKKN